MRDVKNLGSVVETPGSRSAGVTGQPLDDATCNDLTGACGSGERIAMVAKFLILMVALLAAVLGIVFPALRDDIGVLVGFTIGVCAFIRLCDEALAGEAERE
jgi:hypothetical protein